MDIVVLYGGRSPERLISEVSSRQIAEALTTDNVIRLNLNGIYNFENKEVKHFSELYKLYQEGSLSEFEIDKSAEITDSVIEICKLADIVFLSTHGGISENGKLQALLDICNIKYTGNGYQSNAISLDKKLSKRLVSTVGIKTPYEYIEENKFVFPLVIKPNDSGSSIGVQIIKTKEELQQFDLENYNIEEYINGREISIGVIGEKILQPIEIVIEGGFYDYEKKYTPGVVKEICPANISEELKKRLEIYAKTVHDLMGFEVYSRSDFIIDDNGEIYFIETNSIPGMTPTSLLPKEAEAEGINFSNLCKKIINLSIKKYN
ncbi:TPA: ATP-grasp domain-containing protein [Streptococcus suis]|nr:ATP-grasp domain-containing protein [Streptococcus suis]